MTLLRNLSLVAGAAMVLGGCATARLPGRPDMRTGDGCITAAARISFDVETAPHSTCAVLGVRSFAILVTPEHAPPINPSPWYAFRYAARGSEPISVRLDYLAARHRYAPKLVREGETRSVPFEVSADGNSARLTLPPGEGVIAAQEPFAAARYERLIDRLTALPHSDRIELGRSIDGGPVIAVRFGRPTAPALVVLLGRQHPPETTGAIAMDAFLRGLADQLAANPDIGERIQFLAIPLLNPDGVARGHWRANRGGEDLNRDWGDFSQPETRAVKAWLDQLPKTVRPIAMLDFHSTWRNLFYVQSEDETDEREERFLQAWLGGSSVAVDGYQFTVERPNANPGSGTAKNWFHEVYDIPSYTYEVGDETSADAIEKAARRLAQSYVSELDTLVGKSR